MWEGEVMLGRNLRTRKSITKALRALKEATRVSLAKFNSDNKELEIALVKAMNHVERPAKEKYIRAICSAVSARCPREHTHCINVIARRLAKTHNWAVALKTLIVIHRVLKEVEATFYGGLNIARIKCILNLSHFKDDSSPNAFDFSAWIRTYALFLVERLECYQFTNYYIDIIRNLDTATAVLLGHLPFMQQLLFCVLGCQPQGAAVHNSVVHVALSMIASESIKIYQAISEGIAYLVDKFFEMERHDALKVLKIYRRAGHQAERLSEFYEVCTSLDIGCGEEFTKIEQPLALLRAMEDYIMSTVHKDQVADNKISSPKEVLAIEYKKIEEAEVRSASPPPPEPVKVAAPVVELPDFLGLNDPASYTSALVVKSVMALAIVPVSDQTTATDPPQADGTELPAAKLFDDRCLRNREKLKLEGYDETRPYRVDPVTRRNKSSSHLPDKAASSSQPPIEDKPASSSQPTREDMPASYSESPRSDKPASYSEPAMLAACPGLSSRDLFGNSGSTPNLSAEGAVEFGHLGFPIFGERKYSDNEGMSGCDDIGSSKIGYEDEGNGVNFGSSKIGYEDEGNGVNFVFHSGWFHSRPALKSENKCSVCSANPCFDHWRVIIPNKQDNTRKGKRDNPASQSRSSCLECGKSFASFKGLVEHIKKKHPNRVDRLMERIKLASQKKKKFWDISPNRIECAWCSSSFDTGKLYRDHVLENHGTWKSGKPTEPDTQSDDQEINSMFPGTELEEPNRGTSTLHKDSTSPEVPPSKLIYHPSLRNWEKLMREGYFSSKNNYEPRPYRDFWIPFDFILDKVDPVAQRNKSSSQQHREDKPAPSYQLHRMDKPASSMFPDDSEELPITVKFMDPSSGFSGDQISNHS